MSDPVVIEGRGCPSCGTRLTYLQQPGYGFWIDDREGRVLWECPFCEAPLPDVESEAA